MSAIPPLLPDDGRPAEPPRGEFRPAPWGPLEALAGLLFTAFLVLLAGGVFVGIAKEAGLGEETVAFRYGVGILLELTMLAVPFATVLLLRAGSASLGFRRTRWRGLGEGVLLAVGLVLFAEGYELLLARLAPHGAQQLRLEEQAQLKALAGPGWLLVLLAVVIAPIAEEVLFRGFFFGGLRRNLGFAWASGLSAAVFGLLHLMTWSSVPLFVVGLACAAMYERHRSLLPAIAVHVAFNGIAAFDYLT